MSKNWPLLFDTLHYIWKHPSEWNQRYWKTPCGTAMCFAGRAVTLAGHSLVSVECDPDLEDVRAVGVTNENGMKLSDVSDAADFVLGLDGSWDLYNTDNALVDLFTRLESWASKDGVPLPDWFAEGLADAKRAEVTA